MGDIPKIPKQPTVGPVTPSAEPPPTAITSAIDTAALTSNISQKTNVSGAASHLKTIATNGLLLTQLSALGTNLEKSLKPSTLNLPSGSSFEGIHRDIKLNNGKSIPLDQATNDFNRLASIINKRIPNANIPTLHLPLSTSSALKTPLQAINKLLSSQITTIAQSSKILSTAASTEQKLANPLLIASSAILQKTTGGLSNASFSSQKNNHTNKEVQVGETVKSNLQALGAMSTGELLSLFLMTNINNMKDLVTMLTKASMGFTKYINACNDLMAKMTQQQGLVLGNANDTISTTESGLFVNTMHNLGFPNVSCSNTSSHTMNSQQISGNLTTISNGVQLATQKSNQLTTELSQANSMLQKWLQFASNTLQGNSRMSSTIYSNF